MRSSSKIRPPMRTSAALPPTRPNQYEMLLPMSVPTSDATPTNHGLSPSRAETKPAAMTTVSPGVKEPMTKRFSKMVKPATMR